MHPIFDNIPPELKNLPQWVCWIRVESRNKPKPDKIPVNSATGRNADHSDSKTWGSYQRARDFHENQKLVAIWVNHEPVNPPPVNQKKIRNEKGEERIIYLVQGQSTGVGFVLSDTDPFVGIDFDHCAKAGVEHIQSLTDIENWAADLIALCGTYAEISPSGRGIKLILKGEMPGNKGRRNDHYETGGIEIYPHHRFFTLTGQRLEGTPLGIAHNTDAIVEICDRVFANTETPKQEHRKPSETVTGDDKALIEQAMAAANGDKFRKLWKGNYSDYRHEDGTPDQSRADLALCSYLAFWTQGDAARIDRLFRQSALMRDKWEREDYRNWTISKAIEGAEKYDPNYRSGPKPQGGNHAPKTPNGDEPPPNGTGGASQESPATDKSPTSESTETAKPDGEKRFADILKSIGELAIMDSGFHRNEKIQGVIERLVDLSPIEQASLIEKMKGAGLGTKATLESQLKSAIQAKAQVKCQNVVMPQPSALPNIVINTRQMREVTEDTLNAIRRANVESPSLFVRSGILTRIRIDEKGYALAQNLSVDSTRSLMGRTANFWKETTREGGMTHTAVSPPEVIGKDILALPSYPQFPPLVSVVGFPILSESGEFRTQTGYDPESRCYYHAAGNIHIGDVEPTGANVQNAKRLILEDIFGDFPFVDEASKANIVAELLTPLVRTLIAGATPLFAHDAATPGTGKSLLASICTLPFSVSGTSVMTAGRDDDEWRKRITAKLMTGASHVLIDNIKSKLYSGDLAAALTALIWEDRFLGQTLMVRLPVRCTWIATGNNLSFSDEIARRTVWIRLDAKMERPWQRKNFRHPTLESWVGKHRSEVLTALMTLVKRWFAEGKPAGKATLGSYDEWASIVGGILTAGSIEGFLGNAEKLYDTLDSEREAWVDFFQAWAEQYGAYRSGEWGMWAGEKQNVWKPRKNNPPSVGVRDLFLLASHYDDKANGEGEGLLDDLLGQGKETARRINLGRLLKKHRDRVFGGYRLEMLEKVMRAQQFRLVAFGEPKSESSSESSDLDSLVLELNHSKGGGHASILESESSECKTTPSGKIVEKGDTLSINSDGGAGIDSLDSLDSSSDTRKTNDSTDLSKSESKLARFTDSRDVPQAYVDFILGWYQQFKNFPAYDTTLLRIAKKVFPVKMGLSASDQMDAAITALEGKVVCGLSIVRDESGYHLEGTPESEVL